MFASLIIVAAVFGAVAAIILALSVVQIQQYERGVVQTFGRFSHVNRPGLRIVVPVVQTLARVNITEAVISIMGEDDAKQNIMTKDNVLVMVSGVVYYRVIRPEIAILDVDDYHMSVKNKAEAALRACVGQHDLDLLSDTARFAAMIAEDITPKAEAWGVEIAGVEIKELDVDKSMLRSISRQAEAERVRRAKKTEALGELEAAKDLVEAAKILEESPNAMQLRYLAAVTSASSNEASTVVFPVPDIMQLFGRGNAKAAEQIKEMASPMLDIMQGNASTKN